MDKSVPNIDNYKQNFNFLTEIYEVMKRFDLNLDFNAYVIIFIISFENNCSKLGPRINDLKIKFEKTRALLENIPGIDMSLPEQQEYYQNLIDQYKKENELLNSYKDICTFNISKLDKNPDLKFNIKTDKIQNYLKESNSYLNQQANEIIFKNEIN